MKNYAELCYDAYAKAGDSIDALLKYVNENPNPYVIWTNCPQCETIYPTLEGECLVCGTTVVQKEAEEEYDKKSDLIDTCIEQIEEDIVQSGDVDALAELLRYIPYKNLLAFLPEEKWNKFM